jgi:hypothetical protein
MLMSLTSVMTDCELQAHRTGTPFLLKDDLIAAAEASKLADLPIQGNTNNWAAARGAAKWYDGWSNIKVGGTAAGGGCRQ